MNLFKTTPLQPSTLSAGTVVYYADATTHGNEYLHGLQTTKVMVSDEKSFILDNGKRFNPATGLEITRGSQGYLYPYNSTTKAMVKDAEDKLFLVNEVLSIDFSSLTTQQLSMIRDVARGAFTQVTAPSPCSGGCGEAEPILSFVKDLRENTVEVAGIDIDIPDIESIRTVETPIGIADATYELSDEDEDEDDEEYAGNEDYE